MTLHEQQRRIAQSAGKPLAQLAHIPVQHRGKVRVGQRGIAAGDQLHQRAGGMGNRDLPKTNLPGDLRGPPFVLREPVAMQKDDGDAVHVPRLRRNKLGAKTCFVQRGDDLAPCRDALVGLDHVAV